MPMLGTVIVTSLCEEMIRGYKHESEKSDHVVEFFGGDTLRSLPLIGSSIRDDKLSLKKRGIAEEFRGNYCQRVSAFEDGVMELAQQSAPAKPQPRRTRGHNAESDDASADAEVRDTEYDPYVWQMIPSNKVGECKRGLEQVLVALVEEYKERLSAETVRVKGDDRGSHKTYFEKLTKLQKYSLKLLFEDPHTIAIGLNPTLPTSAASRSDEQRDDKQGEAALLPLYFYPYDPEILEKPFPAKDDKLAIRNHLYSIASLMIHDIVQYYANRFYRNNDSNSYTGQFESSFLNINREVGQRKVNQCVPELLQEIIDSLHLYLGQEQYDFSEENMLKAFRSILSTAYGDVAEVRGENTRGFPWRMPGSLSFVGSKGTATPGEGQYEGTLSELKAKLDDRIMALDPRRQTAAVEDGSAPGSPRLA